MVTCTNASIYACVYAYKEFVGAKLKQQLKTLTNQCHRALRY